jgi:hypothetical protein
MKTTSNISEHRDRSRVFSNQIITLADLADFKTELLEEIKKLLKPIAGQPGKKWLKSHEVRKLLDISVGTLQTLRSNRTLEYTKIGGVIYYDIDDINKMMIDLKAKKSNER